MPEPTRIETDVLAAIAADAARCYPQECCGLLIGRATEQACEIVLAMSARNVAQTQCRTQQFVMSADGVRKASSVARQMNLELMGFYHSHPNGVARPSTTDRDHCNPWPEYRHLVQPIMNGSPGRATLWRLEDNCWREETPV